MQILAFLLKRIILGIDPGTVVMGYAAIASDKNDLQLLALGVLKLDKYTDTLIKLKKIYDRISSLCQEFSIQELAVETPVYGQNPQSMLKLGRAQGTAILAGLNHQCEVSEYMPKKVKRAITGNGNASKEQLAAMVHRLIKISEKDIPLDATDALAVAMCHHFQNKLVGSGPRFTSWKDFIAKKG